MQAGKGSHVIIFMARRAIQEDDCHGLRLGWCNAGRAGVVYNSPKHRGALDRDCLPFQGFARRPAVWNTSFMQDHHQLRTLLRVTGHIYYKAVRLEVKTLYFRYYTKKKLKRLFVFIIHVHAPLSEITSMATRPQTAVSGHRIPPGMQPAAGLAKTALIMPPGRKRLSLNGGAETPRPFLSSSFRQDRRVLRAVSRACAASALLRPGAGGMLPPCLAPSFLVHRLPLLRRSGFVERQ